MLTIRRMKESDIPEVARLEKEIFPDPWSEGAISETFEQEQTLLLVAYEDRKLIGYLTFCNFCPRRRRNCKNCSNP